jgi:hypothetical protein
MGGRHPDADRIFDPSDAPSLMVADQTRNAQHDHAPAPPPQEWPAALPRRRASAGTGPGPGPGAA